MKPVEIIHVPHLDGNPTPARCNRRTGEIWINDSVWPTIKPEHRMFILLHEYGHIQLNTSDELAVDAYASDLYIKLGYSLTESVKALSQVLTGKSNQHVDRVKAQLDRAKKIDQKNNNKMTLIEQANTDFTGAWYDVDNYDDLFGLGKKAQARKKERQDAKNYARRTKADAKLTVAESKKIKQEAKAILADQGIVDSSGAGGAITGIVGAVLGKGEQAQPMEATPAPKSKTMLYVGIGAIVLVIAGVAFYFFKRKKN